MKKSIVLLIVLTLVAGSFLSVYGQKKKAKPVADTIHVVGHAHMDMNWLWTYSETMKMCNDNLRQTVAFMDEFPDYTMIQSQAAVYKFVEMVDPPLFKRVQEYVKKGRLELGGGMWTEGDTNLSSGEALSRSFLLGQRYFQSRFGRMAKVGWLPDNFGHISQLPQILKLAGCDYFYFHRTKPYMGSFWWTGPDSSTVLCYANNTYNGNITIDLNLYSLHPDYKETFTEVGNFNEEIIWEFVTNQGLKYSSQYRIERKIFPNGSQGWGHPSPSQNLVDCYETLNGLLPKDDPSYDPQDPWVNRDPRFYASILYDGAPWQDREIEVFLPGGADSNQGNEGWNARWTGYYIRKYVDGSIIVPTNTNTSNPNWPYARYGEILLNYAEAQFYLGNEDITREYLNKIRSRPSVNMPDVTDTGMDLEKRIRNERRIELYCEEHRFFDMRRWKIATLDSLYRMNVYKDPVTGVKTKFITGFMVLNLPERMYLTPIPQSEMEKNPLLEQNPGY